MFSSVGKVPVDGDALADAVGRDQGLGRRGNRSGRRGRCRRRAGRSGAARRGSLRRGDDHARRDDGGSRRRGSSGGVARRRGRCRTARRAGAGAVRGLLGARGVRRQLLDERILALEEAERDQLVGVALDDDLVGVRQLARRHDRRSAGRDAAHRRRRGCLAASLAAHHLGQLEAEDRQQDDRPDGDEDLLAPDALLGQRLDGLAAHAPTAVAPAGAAGIGCVFSIAGEVGAVPLGASPPGTGGVVPSPKT